MLGFYITRFILMNPKLAKLHPYPFEKLAELKTGCHPPENLNHIALSIGEPKHPTPGFIAEAVIEHMHGLSSYPTTVGSIELRKAFSTIRLYSSNSPYFAC